ncbi:tetratricopeptide repeat-containing sensor histidine kinase [Algivirga pacifica]|uniref:histidine kinase n=1 Tax=Algivirga pacifica TaxID=1162670 RepID=A0ABP9D4J8_9BACT
MLSNYSSVLLILLAFCSLNTWGQRKVADSIRVHLQSHPEKDFVYADDFNAYVFAYRRINADTMLLLAKQSLKISQEINYKKGEAVAYDRIGSAYYYQGKYDSAIINYQHSYEKHQDISDSVGMTACLANIANSYDNQGMHDLSLKYYFQVLPALQAREDSFRIELNYYNIGTTYDNMGESEKASEYFFKSLEIAEKINDRDGMAWAYKSIGQIYGRQEDYSKAKEYLLKTLEIRKELKDDKEEHVALLSISRIDEKEGNLAKALALQKEILHFFHKSGFPRWEGITLTHIAQLHKKQEQFLKAEASLMKACAIFEKLNERVQLSKAKRALGELYVQMKAYASATQAIQESMDLATESDMLEVLEDNYRTRYKLDSLQGDIAGAFQHYQQYIALKERISSVEKEKQIRQLQIQYETEEKEQQIQQQENQLEVAQAEIEREQLLYQTFLAISILMFIVLGVIWWAYHQNKKARKKIEEQHTRLEELSTFKENMTSMIVHDLKNPLSTVINLSNYPQVDGKRIRQEGQRMFNLVMNMLDVRKFQEIEIKPVVEDVLLHEILESSRQQVSILQQDKSIVLHVPQTPVTVRVDRYMIERVFVNLLTNAIKFSPLGGSIHLNYKVLKDAWVQVSVKDEGIGIPEEEQETVFSLYGQVGAGNVATSTGLGLSYCKSTVEAHGGRVGLKSEENRGTEVFLTLPLVHIEEVVEEVKKQENKKGYQLEQLTHYKKQLKEIPAYSYSEVSVVLSDLKEEDDLMVKQWKEEVELASLTGDQAQYELLLK